MKSDPRIYRWVDGGTPREAEKAIERILQADDVQHVAVMPDIHAGEPLCNGVIIGTSRLVYPQAVGGDIGCGFSAVKLSGTPPPLDASLAGRILGQWKAACPWNRLVRAATVPNDLDIAGLSADTLKNAARHDGTVQLGTLGRGNHFLELQIDEQDQLWLIVHSGSRALGPLIRDYHLANAVRGGGSLLWLDAESQIGKAYLRDVDWARRYAKWNRRHLLEAAGRVVEVVLGCTADWATYANLDHNHVQRELHDSGELWVHRKGAAPAAKGQSGLTPGSAAAGSFHTEGKGNPRSLCSCSHGAGRSLSRTEARQRVSAREFQRQMRDIWFDSSLSSALRDEAPSAYKDIRRVMAAQKDLVKVTNRLTTVVSYKAGSG
jgi:tRNA-splicing ligase RtcB (3'-phosphate/5'-hydroxy nucleic acid ligase)